MIKRIAIFILLTGLMWGCAQEVEVMGVAVGIDLGVTGVQHTRSAITDGSEVTSIGIFGYATGGDHFDTGNPTHVPNLFFNRHATRTPGNDWSYNPVAFWPMGTAEKSSFFACSPHTSLFPVEANVMLSNEHAYGYPTLTYTVPAEVEHQVDLLYALPTLNINRNTNSGMVLYEMKHALAWIKIFVAPAIMTSVAGEAYTVTSLALSAPALMTRGTLTIGTGAWSAVNVTPAHYLFPVSGLPVAAGGVEEVTMAGACLMMIPQHLANATVHITFTYEDGTGQPDDGEYSFSVPFPSITLLAERMEVFVLQIGTDGVRIVFHTTNTIEEWDEDILYKDIIEVY